MTKLIEESTVSKTVKNAIDTDKLLDWLVENSVLSIALEGKNIHHFPPRDDQFKCVTKCFAKHLNRIELCNYLKARQAS